MKWMRSESFLLTTIFLAMFGSLCFANARAVDMDMGSRNRPAFEMKADQQMQSRQDDEISARVRKGLMRDQTLSIYGKNIQIETQDGEVTLLGPVHSKKEMDTVLRSVRAVPGVVKVTSQMEVNKDLK